MTPLGIDPATWFVAQCLNHCATMCPQEDDVQRQFYHQQEAIRHRSPHLWDLCSGCFTIVMYRDCLTKAGVSILL
jgi:hypothetical protein